ncbi:hypothetical protein NC651_039186 [Populus alba x Populus x berolinensis]|nr:hypothetical protein NC651_039186 [Populus alba x Populus x berolinensis]
MVFKAGLDGDEYVNHSLIARTRKGILRWVLIGLFMEMREEGFEPDEMTLVNVLGACGDLGLGRWVEGLVLEKKMENGASNEAIVLFNGMREADLNPDKVTMIEVLSACSTIGALDLGKWVETHASERGPGSIIIIQTLDDEGRQLFESMKLSFGLVPKVEHYSCMVDLCARAGLLNEAWDLIKKMPGKPDEIVLGSLLAGNMIKLKDMLGREEMHFDLSVF